MKESAKTMSTSFASDETTAESTNRSPSEINAATDLVGIGGPAMSMKIEETEDKDPSMTDDGKDVSKKLALGSASAGGAPKNDNEDDADEGEDNVDDEPRGEGQGKDQGEGEGQDEVPKPAPAGGSAAMAIDNANANAKDDDLENPEGEKTAFPILLHEIVTDPSTDDCVHWLSCGTRFMISDKKKFAEEVLPRFYGHAKFTSFTRRLKRWSFTRVPSGPFMGSYYNANFRRGEPELAARVRYDHPAPLSGSAMQLSKQQLKLQAAGGGMGMGGAGGIGAAMGLGGPGGMFGGNALMGGGGRCTSCPTTIGRCSCAT